MSEATTLGATAFVLSLAPEPPELDERKRQPTFKVTVVYAFEALVDQKLEADQAFYPMRIELSVIRRVVAVDHKVSVRQPLES